MNTISEKKSVDEQAAWNEAHDRLRDFLDTFALEDHAQVSRLTLKLLDQAREMHRQDPSLVPVSLTMTQAQKLAAQWLASNLELKNETPAQLLSSGYVALLLGRAFRTAPETFLDAPLPENLKESMRQKLVVTGPDLNISSMTPRHMDYGPMLGLARSTWHRWNAREIGVALLFWAAVYFISYWWLAEAL